MTWTRIGDDQLDGPAMIGLSRSARLLHIEALVWCNRHLTDGLISLAAITRITDSSSIDREIDALVDAGLWLEVHGGWQLDWSHQIEGQVLKDKRARRAEISKTYRERTARHQRGDHSMCDNRFCEFADTGHDTGHGDGHGDGHNRPPDPSPSPSPSPEGSGSGSRQTKGSKPKAGKPAPKTEPRGARCIHGRPIAGDGAGCAQCDAEERERLAS